MSYPQHPQEDKSRLGGYSSSYFGIAERAFSRIVEIKASLLKEEDESVRSELEDQHFEAGITTILFSALSVEAAINDYGAWQLGDSYFDQHLASLDVASKWVVIPNLICGREIDKSGPAYSALKRLVSIRNELTHNKSRHIDIHEANLAMKLQKRISDFDANVFNAYKAVVLLSLTMDRLVGHLYNPLRSFDKKFNLSLEVPSNLVDVIGDCKNTIAKGCA